MDKNGVKKDLYKSKNMAKFSHYVSGNLYYKVELSDGVYQFPIATIEDKKEVIPVDMGDYTTVKTRKTGIQLSEDLGTTSFESEMKGSDLNRWISKAIDNNEFIKVQN